MSYLNLLPSPTAAQRTLARIDMHAGFLALHMKKNYLAPTTPSGIIRQPARWT